MIIVVVIVIAIFAYLKIRDTPKSKPQMTFEELDAQKKAEKAAKAEKKSTGLTERERYLAEKRKKKE